MQDVQNRIFNEDDLTSELFVCECSSSFSLAVINMHNYANPLAIAGALL